MPSSLGAALHSPLRMIVGVIVGLTITGSIVGLTPTRQNDGKALAEQYCQTCHVLPRPSDLDKPTWIAKVFPIMRTYLGMDPYPNKEKLPHDIQEMLPTHPSMSEDEWFAIAQYYIDAAPQQFEVPKQPDVKGPTWLFRAEPIDLGINPPLTSLVTFDVKNERLLLGDGLNKRLLVLNAQHRVVDSIRLFGPASCVKEVQGAWYVTDMGEFLPHDTAIGALKRIEWVDGKAVVTDVIAPLRRPVHVSIADLNGDKRNDYLICEFGNIKGSIGWYEITASGKKIYHELIDQPGAIRTEIADLNNDRRPDIIVLMAQAREGIFAFINKGKGKFEPQTLLTFPPSHGSSSFTMADLNKDPYPDLIVTTGDVGDYEEPPYKPYHGTYFFHGSKNGVYTQVDFLPMYGAYGALYRDFDLDGKMDLLTFSFFPQLDYGDAGLIQLHTDVSGKRTTYTVDQAITGRWLVSDVADIDRDGDLDVVLGNFSMGPWYPTGPVRDRWTTGGRAALVLRNQTRH